MEFCNDYKKIKTESNGGLTGYCECSAACSKCTTSISIIIIISAIVISIIIIISAIVIVIVIATGIIFVVRATSFFGNRSSSQRCDWLGDGRKNSGKLSNVRRSTILNGIYQIL